MSAIGEIINTSGRRWKWDLSKEKFLFQINNIDGGTLISKFCGESKLAETCEEMGSLLNPNTRAISGVVTIYNVTSEIKRVLTKTQVIKLRSKILACQAQEVVDKRNHKIKLLESDVKQTEIDLAQLKARLDKLKKND